MKEPPIDDSEFRPVEFQLCNGNDVKVAADNVSEHITDTDSGEAAEPGRYWVISVYSNEDSLGRRLLHRWEFRADIEFAIETLPNIWTWLQRLVDTREYRKYDWFEEFLTEFAEQISYLWDQEDAVEHLARLPLLTAPYWYEIADEYFYDRHDSLPPQYRKDG